MTKRALLIDDDPRWHTACRVMCDYIGYTCSWAPSLEDAQNYLTSASFDILILDLGFPTREDALLPPDVEEIDLLVAHLVNSPPPLNILICTGSTDQAKVASVRLSLLTARHNVQVFRKGDDVNVLYERFDKTVGRQRHRHHGGGGTGVRPSLGFSIASLILVFLLGISTFFIAPRFLSSDVGLQFTRPIQWLVSFLCGMVGLVIFSALGIFRGRDVFYIFSRLFDVMNHVVGLRLPPEANPSDTPNRHKSRKR